MNCYFKEERAAYFSPLPFPASSEKKTNKTKIQELTETESKSNKKKWSSWSVCCTKSLSIKLSAAQLLSCHLLAYLHESQSLLGQEAFIHRGISASSKSVLKCILLSHPLTTTCCQSSPPPHYCWLTLFFLHLSVCWDRERQSLAAGVVVWRHV